MGTFISGEDYYLVKPLKEVKLTKKVIVPDEGAEPNEDGTKPVKEVKKRVPANFQLAEVLVVPQSSRQNLAAIGDTIVYRLNSGVDFDLIKGTKLVRFYDVIGLWQD